MPTTLSQTCDLIKKHTKTWKSGPKKLSLPWVNSVILNSEILLLNVSQSGPALHGPDTGFPSCNLPSLYPSHTHSTASRHSWFLTLSGDLHIILTRQTLYFKKENGLWSGADSPRSFKRAGSLNRIVRNQPITTINHWIVYFSRSRPVQFLACRATSARLVCLEESFRIVCSFVSVAFLVEVNHGMHGSQLSQSDSAPPSSSINITTLQLSSFQLRSALCSESVCCCTGRSLFTTLLT